MKKWDILMVVGLLFFSQPAGAQQACTQMWCQEGATLNLEGASWPPGVYHFTVRAGGIEAECEGRLPFASCEGPNVICNNALVTIGESGCALPEDAHSFHAVMAQGTPGHLDVAIKHESGRSFYYEAALEPQCFYPNGEGCDPRPCCSAVMTAKVVWE